MIVSGSPCAVMIVLWNMYANYSTINPFWYGRKYVYFMSRSVTIHIALYLTFVIGSSDSSSLVIRLNAIPYYSLLNGFISCNLPYGKCQSYFIQLYLLYSLMTFFIVRVIPRK